MELSWLDAARPDRRDLAGLVALRQAANAVDTPLRIEDTVTSYAARLRYGGDGDPPVVAVTRDRHGRVIGALSVALPRWDNLHLASIWVVVDPRERRRGLGGQLFEAGVAHARADGRRLVCALAFDQTAGLEFLRKQPGLDPALELVFRRLDVPAVDWSGLDEAYATAERHAAGYELVRMPWPLPDELLPAISTMTEAINDAPNDGLDFEDEAFPPERIRAYETAQSAAGRRCYRLVARERSTGALAGHTVVGVEIDRPWHGGQHDTSVVRAHRGHRLGLLLKIGMLRWLREEEPQLRIIDTDNAASNAHMIRVNEALGFDIYARSMEFQRHL
jgi:RimJ/RimL family protein N-acetyltransferase